METSSSQRCLCRHASQVKVVEVMHADGTQMEGIISSPRILESITPWIKTDNLGMLSAAC